MRGRMRTLALLLLVTALVAVTHTRGQEADAPVDVASEQTDPSAVSRRDVLFQYIPVGEELGFNVSAYLPASLTHDTSWQELWVALEEAVIGTYEFVRLWTIFLVLVSGPVLQLLSVLIEALLPHALTAMQVTAEYVYEMDPLHQAILAAVTVLVVVCYRKGYVGKARRRFVVVRRNLRLRYRQFVLSLDEKARMVAVVVPHVVFVALVYVVVFWSPSVVLELWSNEAITLLLSLGIPLIRTIAAIHRKRVQQVRAAEGTPDSSTTPASTPAQTPAPTPSKIPTRPSEIRSANARAKALAAAVALTYNEWRAYEACLKYWVLWSITVCTISVVSMFIPAFIARYLTIPTYWTNILLAWMHSPVARGDIALYTLLSPLVNPYANRIKDMTDTASGNGAQENEATNFLMRTLVAFNVVKPTYMHLLSDMWSQGPALIGLMFIFTPGFVTARGALLVGFGFPAYVTMGALADKRTRTYEWWLLYFAVAVIVDHLLTSIGTTLWWLPLFQHLKLLVMMWLQFPYFRGAQKIFDTTFFSVFVAARPKPKQE
ncbi:hypothetical protein Poli38472_004513 [Pythium oligandrum]|uniref:HVA22-like protein n=1 Tax=Pythium oligandrum TaxID=41045 RepID=A0A8K1FFY9_PYTOL|nr:hypothetical protein Poli38472_004513 [Pythium oligandrum]|eukprot:TMW59444.1 hypothetical protein Poli38472_004513 [Pythium oligandrum]